MIGDKYLQIRAQLGTALFSLSSLAHGLHAGKEVLQTLQDLRSDLREPFLFLVAGEEKSGKSSLINALFAREIVSADAPPSPDRIQIYKYGAEPGQTPVYDHFVEHYLPDPMLREFNIVDTPASSTITHQHLDIVDQLLPAADLVLFVFSVTNPWSQSARAFLSHIGSNPPRNAIFVLQQCDMRDALEVEAVTAHLEQVIHEKFAGESRVFPVSAKKAMLSKTTGADKEGLFRESNFGALESYIDDVAIHSSERTGVLRSVCARARDILEELAQRTRNAHSIINTDMHILSELEVDFEESRSQAVRLAGGVQWAVADSYERMHKRGEEILQQKRPKDAPAGENAEPAVDQKLEDSIVRQIQHSLELMEAEMLQTWPQFHEIMLTRFPPGNMALQPSDLISERAQLLQQMDLLIEEKKSPEYFGRQAPRLFTGIAEWLQIPAETANHGGLRAFAPALAKIAIADFHQALAAAVEMQGRLTSLGKTMKILMQFRAELGIKREELLTTLEGHLRRAAELFHQEVHAACQPLKNFCSGQLMIYEPRATLAKQMEETLGKTAAALGLPPPIPAPAPAK